MTRLLEEAFRKATALPDAEQDALAEAILADLEDERKSTEAFTNSQDVLAELAEEARVDHRAGRTTPLDPQRM